MGIGSREQDFACDSQITFRTSSIVTGSNSKRLVFDRTVKVGGSAMAESFRISATLLQKHEDNVSALIDVDIFPVLESLARSLSMFLQSFFGCPVSDKIFEFQ